MGFVVRDLLSIYKVLLRWRKELSLFLEELAVRRQSALPQPASSSSSTAVVADSDPHSALVELLQEKATHEVTTNLPQALQHIRELVNDQCRAILAPRS